MRHLNATNDSTSAKRNLAAEVWMFEEEVQHKGVKRKLSEVFNETKAVAWATPGHR